MSLDSTNGAIMLTPNVKYVTEDTMLHLTAVARDHGKPSRNAIGESGRSRRDTVFYLENKGQIHKVLVAAVSCGHFCFYFVAMMSATFVPDPQSFLR